MPILPAEPALLPEGLFGEDRPEGVSLRRWRVLHTRPRQEKSLARQLHQGQIPFYLPLISQRRRMRGRVLTSHVPLFSGYLFLLADREERLAALATSRVVRALEVPDQEGLWRDLRQVHRLITSGLPVTPEERLAPGMPVAIRSGPLAGLKGKILRTASGRRFVVEVDFIHRGASVELEDFTLVGIGAGRAPEPSP
jgi:transcriptional antiterminator RfaH